MCVCVRASSHVLLVYCRLEGCVCGLCVTSHIFTCMSLIIQLMCVVSSQVSGCSHLQLGMCDAPPNPNPNPPKRKSSQETAQIFYLSLYSLFTPNKIRLKTPEYSFIIREMWWFCFSISPGPSFSRQHSRGSGHHQRNVKSWLTLRSEFYSCWTLWIYIFLKTYLLLLYIKAIAGFLNLSCLDKIKLD